MRGVSKVVAPWVVTSVAEFERDGVVSAGCSWLARRGFVSMFYLRSATRPYSPHRAASPPPPLPLGLWCMKRNDHAERLGQGATQSRLSNRPALSTPTMQLELKVKKSKFRHSATSALTQSRTPPPTRIDATARTLQIRLMDLVDTCFLFVSFITLMLARSYASLADEENPGGYDWVQVHRNC